MQNIYSVHFKINLGSTVLELDKTQGHRNLR